jgi:hypothetical protein
MLRVLAVSALVAASLVLGVARPAAAGTPCWKALLTDWYDGRIDKTYEIHCYTDALKHLPPDVQTYSSAHDDILRALQSAKAKLRHEGKKITPATPVTPSAVAPKPTKRSTTTTAVVGPGGSDNSSGPSGGGSTPHKPDSGVAGAVGASDPSSLPVPLLVLGGLALLLVAAGAAGLLVKRLQARKPAP